MIHFLFYNIVYKIFVKFMLLLCRGSIWIRRANRFFEYKFWIVRIEVNESYIISLLWLCVKWMKRDLVSENSSLNFLHLKDQLIDSFFLYLIYFVLGFTGVFEFCTFICTCTYKTNTDDCVLIKKSNFVMNERLKKSWPSWNS